MVKFLVSPIHHSHVTERSHDEGADTRATDGNTRDDGAPLVEVLRDAVQPGQVDDAEAEAHQAPGSEVEEGDGGGHGGQTEAGRG